MALWSWPIPMAANSLVRRESDDSGPPPLTYDQFAALSVNLLSGATLYTFLFAATTVACLGDILLSTPVQRGRPTFWLQILTFAIIIAHYTVLIYTNFRDLRDLFPPSPYLGLATALLECLGTSLTDALLLVKLSRFFPTTLCSRRKRLAILLLPSVLLSLRLITIVWYFVLFGLPLADWPEGVNAPVGRWNWSVATLDSLLNLLVSSYCSCVIINRSINMYQAQGRLRKIVHAQPGNGGEGELRVNSKATRSSRNVSASRWRLVVEAAMMAFLPVCLIQSAIFGIAIAVWCVNDQSSALLETLTMAYQHRLCVANLYLGCFFGLLATQWSTVRSLSELSLISSGLRRSSDPQTPPDALHEAPGQVKPTEEIRVYRSSRVGRLTLARAAPIRAPEASLLAWMTEPQEILLTEMMEDDGPSSDSASLLEEGGKRETLPFR